MTVDAADFDVPFQALFDRTAALVPLTETFIVDGTWTKPANALLVRFELIGDGGDGGDGHASDGGGGGGGAAGERVVHFALASDLPATLDVALTVVTASSSQSTVVKDAVGGVFYLEALRGGPGQNGTATDGGTGGTFEFFTTLGGTGGTAEGSGANGKIFSNHFGGAGGGEGAGIGGNGAGAQSPYGISATGGRGYGAGAAGGDADTGGTGGGGGRGIGDVVSPGAPSGSTGGIGAVGAAIITTFRGIAL